MELVDGFRLRRGGQVALVTDPSMALLLAIHLHPNISRCSDKSNGYRF
jgi:hypothetical protein